MIDIKKAKLLSAIAMPGTLFAAALDRDAKHLYTAGTDGALHAVPLNDEKPTAVRKGAIHDNWASSLVVRQDVILSAGYDYKLVWTSTEGKRIRAVTAHDGWVRKVALTPDGKRAITVGDDMLVGVHDAVTGRRLASFAGHSRLTPEGYLSALYALAISPDGTLAASGDRAGFVRVWNLQTGTLNSEFRAAELYTFDAKKRARAMGGVRGLAFSPDGTQLAVSGIGPVTNVDGFVGPCRIELWDHKAGTRIAFAQDRHQAVLNQVTFASEGLALAAGGGDGGGAIVAWDTRKKAAPLVLKAKGHLQAFALSQDGCRLFTVGHGGMQVWQLTGV